MVPADTQESAGVGRGEADEARVVLVTAPDEAVARRLARALVEARLAACVNVLPGVTSVYRWEGRIEEDGEVLLVAKTRAGALADLERLVTREHPYDVPECVALPAARVEARYLRWLLEAVPEDPAGGAP